MCVCVLKLLATLDPLAAMAETDAEVLRGLLDDVDTESEALRGLWRTLVEENPLAGDAREHPLADVTIPASFSVVVECGDESQQRALFERLKAEGFKCRVLSL